MREISFQDFLDTLAESVGHTEENLPSIMMEEEITELLETGSLTVTTPDGEFVLSLRIQKVEA